MIEASKVNKIEFITKWVETLRTTDIKQGRNCLSSETGDCCLGIACRVGEAMNIEGAGFGPTTHQETYYYFPGQWFSDIMGYRTVDVSHPSLSTPKDIAILNDDARWSFAQIAHALEYTFLRTPSEPTP